MFKPRIAGRYHLAVTDASGRVVDSRDITNLITTAGHGKLSTISLENALYAIHVGRSTQAPVVGDTDLVDPVGASQVVNPTSALYDFTMPNDAAKSGRVGNESFQIGAEFPLGTFNNETVGEVGVYSEGIRGVGTLFSRATLGTPLLVGSAEKLTVLYTLDVDFDEAVQNVTVYTDATGTITAKLYTPRPYAREMLSVGNRTAYMIGGTEAYDPTWSVNNYLDLDAIRMFTFDHMKESYRALQDVDGTGTPISTLQDFFQISTSASLAAGASAKQNVLEVVFETPVVQDGIFRQIVTKNAFGHIDLVLDMGQDVPTGSNGTYTFRMTVQW